MIDRLIAEHEAAHAVVARELGLTVAEVRVDAPGDLDGLCRWRRDWQRPVEDLAVTVAPELWLRLRRDVFGGVADDGCGDDREIVTRRLTELGLRSLDERLAARRVSDKLAMDALRDRFDDVMTIADRLQRYRVWTLEGGWRGRVSPRRALQQARAAAEAASIPGPRHLPEPPAPAPAPSERPVVAAASRSTSAPVLTRAQQGAAARALLGLRDPLVAGVVRRLLGAEVRHG